MPIGSGVTEAACKTIVTQRLKLSGMRWSNEGGQAILTLRILLLSEIWDEVRDAMLKSIPSPVQATPAPQARTITQNAA